MQVSVRDFLIENPYTSLDVLTPKGVLHLPANQAQWILTDKGQNAKLKANGSGGMILASQVLELVIWKIVPIRQKRNYVFLITSTLQSIKARGCQPHMDFEQLAFDLSDIPPQWLTDDKPPKQQN